MLVNFEKAEKRKIGSKAFLNHKKIKYVYFYFIDNFYSLKVAENF